MARAWNRLSARTVETVSTRGMYADGGGLWLQVSAFKTKSWIFRYQRDGRERQMGLGATHTVSLAQARKKAEGCRRLLADGIDPIEHREAEKAAKKAEAAKAMTFRQCAEAYIAAHAAGWKNTKHAAQWTNTLSTYAYPLMGGVNVAAIDTAVIMKVLEPIWTTKTETASRVRGRIEAVLDWAKVRGYRKHDNPARWRGHLDKLLPQRTKVRKVEHHAALPYAQVGAFMEDLRAREGTSARALEFAILTATRTGEVMGAKWSEIDFHAKVWTVPGDRMKAGKEHRVPLSSRALHILEAMKEVATAEYVFPGVKPERPLSNMAFLQLLKRMDHDDLTAHGFRSTFRDWAAERTNFPREVAEMALAHTVSDKVEAAYRRGDLAEKRRMLMEAWSKFCATPSVEKGKVVAMKATRT